MPAEPSDIALLDDPVARELLGSTQVARLAYTWSDGTPRVVPIWFHFDGQVITMCSPPRAPKLHVLADRPEVAITIDDERAWPYRALLIRGQARVEMLGELAPEYEAAARRYLGDEQAEAWVAPPARATDGSDFRSADLALRPRLRDPLPQRTVCLTLLARAAHAGRI